MTPHDHTKNSSEPLFANVYFVIPAMAANREGKISFQNNISDNKLLAWIHSPISHSPSQCTNNNNIALVSFYVCECWKRAQDAEMLLCEVFNGIQIEHKRFNICEKGVVSTYLLACACVLSAWCLIIERDMFLRCRSNENEWWVGNGSS